MANKSDEKRLKSLERQWLNNEKNPKLQKRIEGRIASLKGKMK